MRKVFGRTVPEADVRVKPSLTFAEQDDPASVQPDVVVNRGRPAVTPVGQHDAVVAHRAVVVVVVPAEDSHYIPALKHLAEKAGINVRAADLLTMRAVGLEIQAFPECVGIFRQRNMHERDRGKRLLSVFRRDRRAGLAVPFDLVGMGIVVVMTLHFFL